MHPSRLGVAVLQVGAGEGAAMSDDKPVFEKSWSIEDVQHLRLIMLLEDHGLTLPPETYSLKGLAEASRSTGAGRRWTTPAGPGDGGGCCCGCPVR